jgi:hypothetical protein
MKSGILIAWVFLGLALFYQAPAFAEDELYLCGIVKDVDTPKALVGVDVTSGSCRGLHTFKQPAANGVSFKVDERICFFIDSNRCKDDSLHGITKVDAGLQQEAGGAVSGKESTKKGRQPR